MIAEPRIAGPRGHVEHLIVDELPWQPWIDADGMSGWRVRVLSRELGGAGMAFIARAAPCSIRRRIGVAGSTTELLVLSGDLVVGGRKLGPGGYCRWPRGFAIPALTSSTGAELYMTCDGMLVAESAIAQPEARPVFVDAATETWTEPPAYEGRSIDETVPGMTMMALRADDPEEPYTFLVRTPPGWADPREESHDTWEEAFLLSGDFLMGDFGRLVAGSYIFRPGTVPHGPQATHGGAVFLARGEKRINFCFRPISDAEDTIRHYFAMAPALPAPPRFVAWL